MKTLHDMKFRVHSPEHSEEIQQQLFRIGFNWIDGKKPKHTDSSFLYATDHQMGMYLSVGGSEYIFNDHDHTETTLEELKAM